jgi:CHASE3 domain sensor protein
LISKKVRDGIEKNLESIKAFEKDAAEIKQRIDKLEENILWKRKL